MAISTYGVTLKCGESAESLTKLVDIKAFPDLGASPEMLETTTLSDKSQTFISGIQTLAALEFTANYTDEDFAKVDSLAGQPLYYALEFGQNGSAGIFEWQGEHTAWVVGGGTNVVVDMKISIAPSTKITKKATE